MARKLRVSVDYDRCTGVGACEQVCPEVFFMNDEGLPDVLEEEPHETLWAAVERAEEACPEEAVILEWVEPSDVTSRRRRRAAHGLLSAPAAGS